MSSSQRTISFHESPKNGSYDLENLCFQRMDSTTYDLSTAYIAPSLILRICNAVSSVCADYLALNWRVYQVLMEGTC